jgi:hypothetical protein
VLGTNIDVLCSHNAYVNLHDKTFPLVYRSISTEREMSAEDQCECTFFDSILSMRHREGPMNILLVVCNLLLLK